MKDRNENAAAMVGAFGGTVVSTTPFRCEGVSLCQDCLRLLPLRADESTNHGTKACPHCRGDICECGWCIGNIPSLFASDWGNSGLQRHAQDRALSWNPKDGLMLTPLLGDE